MDARTSGKSEAELFVFFFFVLFVFIVFLFGISMVISAK